MHPTEQRAAPMSSPPLRPEASFAAHIVQTCGTYVFSDFACPWDRRRRTGWLEAGASWAAVVGKDGKEKSDGKLLDSSGKSKKMSLKELKDMKEGGAPSKAGDREARLVKEQKEADKRAAENAKRSTASRDMDNMTASGNWR